MSKNNVYSSWLLNMYMYIALLFQIIMFKMTYTNTRREVSRKKISLDLEKTQTNTVCDKKKYNNVFRLVQMIRRAILFEKKPFFLLSIHFKRCLLNCNFPRILALCSPLKQQLPFWTTLSKRSIIARHDIPDAEVLLVKSRELSWTSSSRMEMSFALGRTNSRRS